MTAPESNPADIAKTAIAGLEADLYDIVADDVSRQVQAALDRWSLCALPQLP